MSDAMDVQRYDFDHPACNGHGCCGGGSIAPNDGGEYVTYADYLALTRERDNARRTSQYWKDEKLASEREIDTLTRERDEAREELRDLNEAFCVMNDSHIALHAERDEARRDAERLAELAALSGEVFAFAITDSKMPNLETRRQLHDAVKRAIDAARTAALSEATP